MLLIGVDQEAVEASNLPHRQFSDEIRVLERSTGDRMSTPAKIDVFDLGGLASDLARLGARSVPSVKN